MHSCHDTTPAVDANYTTRQGRRKFSHETHTLQHTEEGKNGKKGGGEGINTLRCVSATRYVKKWRITALMDHGCRRKVAKARPLRHGTLFWRCPRATRCRLECPRCTPCTAKQASKQASKHRVIAVEHNSYCGIQSAQAAQGRGVVAAPSTMEDRATTTNTALYPPCEPTRGDDASATVSLASKRQLQRRGNPALHHRQRR